MTVAILCIGTELTRGELLNTNAHWLADALTAMGLEVGAIDSVDDDRDRITRALERIGVEHEAFVCTGGLGPTTDDITTECAAAVLGVPLERDPASLAAIGERMQRFGRAMAPSNAKQADFPRGARVLENRWGTAPGFSLKFSRATGYFLPGVPREMTAMFEAFVAPELRKLVHEPIHQHVLRTFGLPESSINDRLAGVEAQYGVLLGYRAHFPEIEVKVLARGPTAELRLARARAAADAIRDRLGTEQVYGEGWTKLPELVGALLLERGLMIATAESCTGGYVSKLLTDAAGASRYFSGGVVAYSNSIKEKMLGVDPALLEQHGAVSREVAIAMAEGARTTFGVDLALSVTGIAGPTGGTPDKPVGLVHYAVAAASGTEAYQFSYSGTRAQTRLLAAYAALAKVRKLILEHDH